MNFVCPKCKKNLKEINISLKCENGHSFDRAREGYYNLLLSSVKGNHGDNREMLKARRDFLDTGAYRPLADKVSEFAYKYLHSGNLLDIGCGEGYYTNIIEKRFSDKTVKTSAFDISKDAVKLVAKRNKTIELAVASAYHIPTADESFDMAINMFSPLAAEEIYRTLKKDGIFIMAIPGENHLFGLKAATYKTPYKNQVGSSELKGFSLIESEKISYTLTLDSSEKIKSLFMMTPYAYRTSPSDKERVLSLRELSTEIEFIIFVYRKD